MEEENKNKKIFSDKECLYLTLATLFNCNMALLLPRASLTSVMILLINGFILSFLFVKFRNILK